jgi:hypothetical protein
MKRPLLAFLGLAACTGGERANSGKCPAGETCSPLTPNGLHFIGNQLSDDLNLSGPSPTAIGGSQEVAIQYDRGDGILVALDLPFTADDDGGAGVKVTATSGSVVTVTGEGSRSNYLRILDADDGTLFDRKMLAGAALDTIELYPMNLERFPAHADLAWAAGDIDLAVTLWGDVQEDSGPTSERLVDSSMSLDLAGSERTAWDSLHLASATPGTATLSVTAGDKPPADMDVVVVDNADQVVPLDSPDHLTPNLASDVCFSAISGNRTVIGFPWTFTVEGVAVQGSLEPNCVTVTTTRTSGTLAIVGSAGGQSATLQLTIGEMARTAPRPARVRPTTAGDRASM